MPISKSQLLFKDNNCISFTFVYRKGCFRYKIEKVNTTIEFCIFELVWLPSFGLNWQFFWTKFTQKGSKTEKVNTAIDFCLFELMLVVNFNLNWQFWFFLTNLLKKGISSQNGKIALLRASMVVTYYIKLFRTGADRHNGIPSSRRDNKYQD